MKRLTLLILILSSLQVRAGVEKILSSRSTHQLTKVREELMALQISKLACELELKRHQIPKNCYHWLALKNGKVASLSMTWQNLERHCLSLRPIDWSLDELNKGATLRNLGERCRAHLRLGIKLKRYQLEEKEISQLILDN